LAHTPDIVNGGGYRALREDYFVSKSMISNMMGRNGRQRIRVKSDANEVII
jgi:hypothetical protein